MSQDYLTVKEVILQMLASPTWQNQYNSFIAEYCIYFNDEEENDIEKNNLFKQFQAEMALVYDSFFSSLGLDNQEELQIQIIKEILNNDGDEEVDIQQLLALSDFQVFKAEMSFQNKRQEIVAIKQIVDEKENQYNEDNDEKEEEEDPEDEYTYKLHILKIKLEYEQLQEELELQQAMQISFDTPNQKKLEKIQELLEIVVARLDTLQQEEEGVMQQNQQMGQKIDRKTKLIAQLQNLPPIDLSQEQDIFKKIQQDVKKI